MTIDLNCDMGELEDIGLEAALMQYITSASIACGGHTGDEETMERSVRLALRHGVRIGAHPSYPDRADFGRKELPMTAAEISATVRDQVERLVRVVNRAGGEVVHVKPHGALYNVAARNEDVATAIGEGVRLWNARATLFGLAGSSCLRVWEGMGFTVAAEGFADRRYEADGSLRPRRFEDALITDPYQAAQQALRLAREQVVKTICVHSDTPGALEILKACRQTLTS
jgi:UPF0271 protein